MPLSPFVDILEELYAMLHRREFVSPDPLQYLYNYPDPDDREVVAVLASSLAYGRVHQALKSIGRVLEAMGNRPARFVEDMARPQMQKVLRGFKHRFNTGDEMAALLYAVGKVRRQYGSLEDCLLSGMGGSDENVMPGLVSLTCELHKAAGGEWNHLLPDVRKGGACKRLHLMLRWLVREDVVDVGGWQRVRPAKLILPLDVHMHRLACAMGATKRSAADAKAAVEATAAFRQIVPTDPVRYDFSLTRLGIRRDMAAEPFVDYFRRQVEVSNA